MSSCIRLHVILCGTLFFCWKFSEADFNAFKVACLPMCDGMPVVYIALYEDNTDMHVSAYLLLCVNAVLFTMSAHVYTCICGTL